MDGQWRRNGNSEVSRSADSLIRNSDMHDFVENKLTCKGEERAQNLLGHVDLRFSIMD